MADVERSWGHVTGAVLVAIPDSGRAAPIARALAAEQLMPVVAFTAAALTSFAADQDFATVVVDPAIDARSDPCTLLDTLRATTPAPIVVLGYVPGDGAAALAPGISGLLGADAPAADVVGTVVTAIARGRLGDEVLASDDLMVDSRNFEAWRGTQRLDLTPTELRLLATLVAADGDLVTKQTLQKAAWGSANAHDDNRLQAHMRRLRTKLDGGGTNAHSRVRTVRGLGFRLELSAPGPGGSARPGAPVHEPTQTGRNRHDRIGEPSVP
jgi:DNA-binding winged helix-turn-helix (wHTH) protein